LMFGDIGVCVELHLDWWANERATPLWVEVQGRDFKNPGQVRDLLRDYETVNPPRLVCPDQGTLIVPLELPFGVERDVVVNRLVSQLREVAHKLNPPS